jgi:3',5'-nucleoside bisphosphate phosphatase
VVATVAPHPREESLVPGYDLHTHTDMSDGTTTIEHNVRVAVELGLEGLGVTDHDTTEPFERAFAAAEGTSLEIIPGVEFSAEQDGSSVHVLGYWVDPDNVPLQEEMARLRNERFRRAEQIVQKFHGLGIEVSFARVQELAGEAPIGRPHIARAVIETGAVSEMQEVFDRYLADDGPAYVPKYAVGPVRAVELIRGAGGVAVVAHPGLYSDRSTTGSEHGLADDVIQAMAAAGMAGIEADHPVHTDAQREHYRDLARALHLVVTAGSDFHGEAKDLDLGQCTTSRDVVEILRERRG